MTIDPENAQHIIADEGKVFRRIEDGQIYGTEIFLGYSYYIGGVKLETPHLDVPSDFEEIDDPEPPVEEIPEEQQGPQAPEAPQE